MQSLYLLVPLSIVLAGAAIWAFFWAVNQGQFEELDEPARAILDDDLPPESAHDASGPEPRP